MAIVYRTDGPHGAGKGSNLTPAEVDANFYSVYTALQSAQASQRLPDDIADILVTGSTFEVITAGGEVYGPFQMGAIELPIQYWGRGSLVKANTFLGIGSTIYLVLQDHILPAEFDPRAMGSDGPLYKLVYGKAYETDIALYLPGHPGAGVALDAPLCTWVAGDDSYLVSLYYWARICTGALEAVVSINGDPVDTVTIDRQDTPVNLSLSGYSVTAGDLITLGHFDHPELATDVALTFTLVRR